MTNLPKEGESQRIGRLAKKVLAINMPLNWIDKEQDGDSDFGIDYLIQLKIVLAMLSLVSIYNLKALQRLLTIPQIP
ncbi:TPA: hypothetical protein ACWX32_001075 [Acinetobacter baumannii]